MKLPETTPRQRAYLRVFRLYELRGQSPTYGQLKDALEIHNPRTQLMALLLRGLLVRHDVGGHRKFVYYLTEKGREEAAHGLQAKARRELKLKRSIYGSDG